MAITKGRFLMENEVLKRIKETGIVAIVRGIERTKVLHLVKALKDGGIDCIEITFNTPNASKMITDIKREFQGDVFVGAGTVTNLETAKVAYESGAEFILSPSLHKDVIEFCKKHNIVSIPGAYTPTEVVMADQYGADIVKVFPAGAIDSKFIKLIRGPLNDIDMMAVGGVNLNNIGEFIESGSMSVGIGSSLINKEYIEKQEYDKITYLAKSFIEKIRRARDAKR